MEAKGVTASAQIFGTDIDDSAVAIARAGRYRKPMAGCRPSASSAGSPRMATSIARSRTFREMCVFSTHSVVKDPPFSKLDLISCRNLLIYLNDRLAGPRDANVPLRAAAGRLSLPRTIGRRYAKHQTLRRHRQEAPHLPAPRNLGWPYRRFRFPHPAALTHAWRRRRRGRAHPCRTGSTMACVASWRNIRLPMW